MGEMQPQITAALIAGSITALGWLIIHILTAVQSEQNRRAAARLAFIERQIEFLYGPLCALVHEGRSTFDDLLSALGRTYVFEGDKPLPQEELDAWLFWVEVEFLPRNDKIKLLLLENAHLIEGPVLPKTYIAFMDHANSWAINHRRWKERGVTYSWHSRTNFPKSFEADVLTTFRKLKATHSKLISRLKIKPPRLKRLARRLKFRARP